MINPASVLCMVGFVSFGCARSSSSGDPTPSPPSPQDLPKIEFDSRTHDFGVVNEGSVAKHAYVVRNAGTALLTLRPAHASCGCVTVTQSTEALPPGGTGTLEIAQSTRGFPGESRMTLTVESNDPKEPISQLEFRALVENLLDFDPPYPLLNAPVGVASTERVWLRGKLADQAKLSLKHDDCGGRISAIPITKSEGRALRRGFELKRSVALTASGTCDLVFTTDLANPPELQLRVNYVIEGAG